MTALALLMGVGSHLIRQFSPQDHWIWLLGVIHMEPAHYLQYILMFTYGIILTRSKGLQRLTNRTGMIALAIGVGFVLINTFRTGTVHSVIESYFGLFESFLCLFLSIGLLATFGSFGCTALLRGIPGVKRIL